MAPDLSSIATHFRTSAGLSEYQLSFFQSCISFVVIYALTQVFLNWRKRPNIPGVGYGSIPLLSTWIASYRFMRQPAALVKAGVSKYNRKPFRICTLQGEYVIVSDRDMISQYLKQPDDVLGMQEAADEAQQITWTMGYGVSWRTYHVGVVKREVTNSIRANCPIMLEEMRNAMDTLIGSPADYQPFGMYDIIAMTIAKVSNRVFVGTELSRNQEFLKLATDYAQAVVISAEMLRVFPDWVKTVIVKFMPVTWYRRQAIKYLRPFIQARLDGKTDGNGKKFDDLIQWLIDAAPPIEKTIPQLSERIMALNVASIHTTTMTFSGAIYALAAEPEKYADELRAEILENLDNGQITRETVNKLKKMDSFIREAARMNNAGLFATARHVKKKFTFSDGTVLPVGAKIGTPALIVHRDAEVYDEPDKFDGFRFSRGDQFKGIVTTDVSFHLFGHGKHACPGRFFAANEMKLLFSALLLRYDFKLAPGTGPNQTFIGTMAIPDTTLKVLVKARNL